MQNGFAEYHYNLDQHDGAFVEDIIAAIIGRLHYCQTSQFACQENEDAIRHLKLALRALESRTQRRQASGKFGEQTPD